MISMKRFFKHQLFFCACVLFEGAVDARAFPKLTDSDKISFRKDYEACIETIRNNPDVANENDVSCVLTEPMFLELAKNGTKILPLLADKVEGMGGADRSDASRFERILDNCLWLKLSRKGQYLGKDPWFDERPNEALYNGKSVWKERISFLLEQFHAAVSNNDSCAETLAVEAISCQGIFAYESLIEALENGDESVVEVFGRLRWPPNERPEMTKEGLLTWWNQHLDEFSLPPTISEKAGSAKLDRWESCVLPASSKSYAEISLGRIKTGAKRVDTNLSLCVLDKSPGAFVDAFAKHFSAWNAHYTRLALSSERFMELFKSEDLWILINAGPCILGSLRSEVKQGRFTSGGLLWLFATRMRAVEAENPWSDEPLDHLWKAGTPCADKRISFLLSEWRTALKENRAEDATRAKLALIAQGIFAYHALFREIEQGREDAWTILENTSLPYPGMPRMTRSEWLVWWREHHAEYEFERQDPKADASPHLEKWHRSGK